MTVFVYALLLLFTWISFKSFVFYTKTTNVAAHAHFYKSFHCKNNCTLLLIKLQVSSFRYEKKSDRRPWSNFCRIGSHVHTYSLCFLDIQWIQIAYDSIEHIFRKRGKFLKIENGDRIILLKMFVVLFGKLNKNQNYRTSIDLSTFSEVFHKQKQFCIISTRFGCLLELILMAKQTKKLSFLRNLSVRNSQFKER